MLRFAVVTDGLNYLNFGKCNAKKEFEKLYMYMYN